MNPEAKNLRNTRQRKYMLEILRETNSHPNAIWLFEKMKPQFPNLSLSTVYRNLGILESQGLLMRLSCGGAFDRYDGNVAMHSHFYCRECGQVYDLEAKEIENSAMESAKADGNKLEGCQITFHGVCKSCLNKDIIN